MLRGSICATISGDSAGAMARRAEHAFKLGADLVEFRLDHLAEPDTGELVETLSPHAGRCIITVRSAAQGGKFRGTERQRLRLLTRACEMRPVFADVEFGVDGEFAAIVREVRAMAGQLIFSWHDFEGTPADTSLQKRLAEMLRYGGISKLVTLAKSFEDNVRILSLYRRAEPGRLVAFCMGERGMFSRVLSVYCGSPIAYASLPGEPVAPGQISLVDMKRLVRAVG